MVKNAFSSRGAKGNIDSASGRCGGGSGFGRGVGFCDARFGSLLAGSCVKLLEITSEVSC